MTELRAPRGTNQDALTEMIEQWAARRARNLLRSIYYDGKNALRDFGISLPPSMRNIDVALGWPAKAVNVLASRMAFDGFVVPGEDQDPFDISDMMTESGIEAFLPQAITSALTHAVSFLTITPGDTSKGEPQVLFLPKSATQATGLWDSRTQSLSDGLSITKTDPLIGLPTELVWYSREHVTVFRRVGEGKWETETQPNRTGRVWMEPLVFRPELDRPFGHSRITRAVMFLTDAALRSMARSEGHAEFFASPQRWALGAEEDAFGGDMDRWKAVMSRMLAISKDEDGDLPTLGQFAQSSPQPHFDHQRHWAALFAGETSVPLSSLGIVQDNPSSAEAIYAAKEDLVIEAASSNRVMGSSLRRGAITGVMLRDNLTEPPAELLGLRAKWRNPATPSVVSASDAVAKQISAIPWIAESEVALEALGYDDATITRLLADKRRTQGGGLLERMLEQRAQDSDGGAPLDDMERRKLQMEVLGMARRAGMSDADALREAGLSPDIEFTGVPVAVRPSKDEAADLEER